MLDRNLIEVHTHRDVRVLVQIKEKRKMNASANLVQGAKARVPVIIVRASVKV